jgi:hypothetical protein
MATLRNCHTGLEVTLVGRSLVGRSHLADIKLTARGASNEHASIGWDGTCWTLRDLTSRNGTRINNSPLTTQSYRLCVGDEIIFGDPVEHWRWLDGNAPNAMASDAEGHVVEGRNGLLLLPDERAPQASVSVRDGQWQAEVDGTAIAVTDGATLCVGSRVYRLRLPLPDPTSNLTRTLRGIPEGSSPSIGFQVSSDEENVDIQFHTITGPVMLPTRSFNYMLLVLARARVEDARAGHGEADSGWLYTQDLARKLGTTVEGLNVDVYRARRAVAELGVLENPGDILERRRSSGQIRLGIASIRL